MKQINVSTPAAADPRALWRTGMALRSLMRFTSGGAGEDFNHEKSTEITMRGEVRS